MAPVPKSIERFLAARRIAVAGVSRDPRQPANLIFHKLRSAGYEVVPVNPRATEIEGVPCFPNLSSVPGGIEAVVAATPPAATAGVAHECAALKIDRLWIHRSFGEGSVSTEALGICRDAGIEVIEGACPMMYVEPVDFPHRCFRGILRWTGKMPAESPRDVRSP